MFLFSWNRRVPHQEISLDYMREWLGLEPSPERSLEVAPGVRVALVYTGGFVLPGNEIETHGAVIAVWKEES